MDAGLGEDSLAFACDRPGKPVEIAATVAFLASDNASYFAGAVLIADGGMIQV